MSKILLAIHGGAGTILKSLMTPEKEKAYSSALSLALKSGYDLLEKGGSSIDAVQAAVMSLEDCPLFNAGRGSVFTHDGSHEMDASIMDGKKLEAGAVASINNIRNPVLLARTIMNKSEHVFLAGRGAEEFALQNNIPSAEANIFSINSDMINFSRFVISKKFNSITSDKKFGTVGAVAIDVNGNLAAATSTAE